jgi:hypothetical protein
MTPQEFADKYLTPPVRLRYIYNLKNYRRLTLESKLKGDEELEVLNWAFLWEHTPEGHYYWERIQDNIVYGKMRDDIDRRKYNRIMATPRSECISYSSCGTSTTTSGTSSTSDTATSPRFGGWTITY